MKNLVKFCINVVRLFRPLSFSLILVTFLLHSASNNDAGFILITSLYREPNEKRAQELAFCLCENSKNSHIKKIHVFFDAARPDKTPGATIIANALKSTGASLTPIKGRPSFHEMISLANNYYAGENVIISNGDICFDDTLSYIRGLDWTGKFLALTRWEVGRKSGKIALTQSMLRAKDDLKMRQTVSFDSWIFQAPLTCLTNNGQLEEVLLGQLYCDGHIVLEALKSGLEVANPCLSVIIRHIHSYGGQNWSKESFIPRRSEFPQWCRLPECTVEEMHNYHQYAQRAVGVNLGLKKWWNVLLEK